MSHTPERESLTLTGTLDGTLGLTQPLPITAEWRDEYVTITAPALGMRAMGQSPEDALEDLRATIADRYRDLAGRGDNRTASAEQEWEQFRAYVGEQTA